MNYQKDQNTLPLKEVNFEISALLENYIDKSRERKTPVLKQRSPEKIAEAITKVNRITNTNNIHYNRYIEGHTTKEFSQTLLK